MNETKQSYLQRVLDSHRMKHIGELMEKYREKRDGVKEAIEKRYSSNIYSPINSGSFAKHTAINSSFDLDIAVPFKRNSFATLEDLYVDVFDFLSEIYRTVATVRRQKVSIGLKFYPDKSGDHISLDIVPGRELNQDQYEEDKNMNLFVATQYGKLDEKKYIQTNIQRQIDHIKNTGENRESIRQIIRLFKIWKSSLNKNYKSFFFELITIKAFDKAEVEGDLWEKLKIVMTYIIENVNKDDFKLPDPGNSNNDVMDTLASTDRSMLAFELDNILRSVETNDENIKLHFLINNDYDDNEPESGSYGIKGNTPGGSIPTNTQRFG